MSPQIYAAAAAGVMLLASIGTNVYLYNQIVDARTAETLATERADNSNNVAKACSEGVQNLVDRGKQRDVEFEAKLAAAEALANAQRKRADEILSKPASAPGDDCKSVRDRAMQFYGVTP